MLPQDFNLDDLEIIHTPVPENETPRQFLQRMTGHDFDHVKTCTWEDIREFPLLQKWMTKVLMNFSKPQIILRLKKK